jgi:protease I
MMNRKQVLMPLPSYGFDPTESAIPWKILTDNDVEVVIATPSGQLAAADSIMLTGQHLGIWKSVLQARHDAVHAYRQMELSEAFLKPISYAEATEREFDALLLSGGHDAGVKEYLESTILHQIARRFFAAMKPVAAICHGVLVLARSRDAETGKSVLHSYRTTSLLQSQEITAYNLTRLWLGDYYRTYPGLTVENEVTAALTDASNFQHGPKPLFRDDAAHLERGFALRDRNYLSARWPGDAYSFSMAFVAMLREG